MSSYFTNFTSKFAFYGCWPVAIYDLVVSSYWSCSHVLRMLNVGCSAY